MSINTWIRRLFSSKTTLWHHLKVAVKPWAVENIPVAVVMEEWELEIWTDATKYSSGPLDLECDEDCRWMRWRLDDRSIWLKWQQRREEHWWWLAHKGRGKVWWDLAEREKCLWSAELVVGKERGGVEMRRSSLSFTGLLQSCTCSDSIRLFFPHILCWD